MRFKDRRDAAVKLFAELRKNPLINPPAGGKRKNVVVVSLLRGGVVLGSVLSKKLEVPHLPLVCTKIGAPLNEELAIGALAFDVVYLEKRVIDSLFLDKSDIRKQIEQTKIKFIDYSKRFSLNEKGYEKLSDKTVVIVDDGIATGATMKAAALFVKERGASKVIVAAPVSSDDLNFEGIDQSIILYRDPYFSAVSQFYEEFPQIEDAEVKKILKNGKRLR